MPASAIRSWPVLPIGQVASRHYLRFASDERSGGVASVQSALQALGVQVQQALRVQHPADAQQNACVLVTEPLTGNALARVLDALKGVAGGLVPVALWRVEDLNG